jgi:hypothetical protein
MEGGGGVGVVVIWGSWCGVGCGGGGCGGAELAIEKGSVAY